MTIVHPPSTDRDLHAIESLDFSPPCEYDLHDEAVAAVWAVWRRPCGCKDVSDFLLFCDPCWQFLLSGKGGYIYCTACGMEDLASNLIVRVERI